ncbi:MAG: hypothetical protein V7701_17755, partial [Sneathiella sp.]
MTTSDIRVVYLHTSILPHDQKAERMKEFETNIATVDGDMDTFVCYPEEGGPFPAVIMYMDAPGIREELR